MSMTMKRLRAVGLVSKGWSAQAAAGRVGVSASAVKLWVRLAGMTLQLGRLGGLAELRHAKHRVEAPPGPLLDRNGRLDLAGRLLIQVRLRDRWSYRAIAAELGVAPSTVSREIAAHAVDGKYRGVEAHRAAVRARHRSGNPKLVRGARLWDLVVAWLNDKLSPEQISGRLRREFPDQHDMQVSPETIYQALYVQAAGGLRHELTVEQALRQHRTTRKPRSKLGPRSNRSWIGEATISNRPAEAADRAIPGHWEGDLIIGTEGRSALITLVERRSRFLLISRIDAHDTTTVTSRLTAMAESLPDRFTTITWDRGVEMADPALFEPRGVLLGHLRRDRGHVDEHGTALHRICRPAVEKHLAYDRPAVEDGEDVVGALNAVDRAVGDPCALHGERVGLGACAVPDGGREAGLDQVGGHRRAHDASAEKCDVVSHWRVPLG